MTKTVFIGVDPGVTTGVGVWVPATEALSLFSVPVWGFFDLLREYDPERTLVRIEDSRQRKWFGKGSRDQGKIMGAGWVRTLSGVYENFCKAEGYECQMVHPVKGGTKLTASYFKKITGYNKQCSDHARDAAMLVYGMCR